jgi:hypothetical protein
MPGTGTAIGTGAGAIAGSFIPGIGTIAGGFIGGALGGIAEGIFGGSDAPAAPQGEYMPIDPNVGIGQGSFGLTPEEQAYYERVRQERIATYGDPNKLKADLDARQAALAQFEAEWAKANPPSTHDPVENSRGAVTPQARREAAQRAMADDPRYAELKNAVTGAETTYRAATGAMPQFDMSDPGRFAAMSQTQQGRAGVTLNRYGVPTTAGPEIAGINRTDAPRTYDPGELTRAQSFNAREFGVDKFGVDRYEIDQLAGLQDYNNYKETRAKNVEVMGSVQDRAMGRGGPSPAELQMKQGQDRAIAQQAALAASGGQMDASMARRQAMLGAAQIGQRTASDTSLLRANEQIAAQNTFSGMANAQLGSDLSARGQTFGQAQARAQNDFSQSLGTAQFNQQQALQAAQFQRAQSLENAQLGMNQAQFNAGQANQYNLQRAQQMAQQGQFGAQFGLSQEQAIAQNLAQQRQFNAQFYNQQNQFGAQFGAQQEMNQAGLTMQQRAMNDQMTGMYMNQYMNSRGMQQANAFQNQNAYNQMAGINAGVGVNNARLEQQGNQFQQQQTVGLLNAGATAAAGYMNMNNQQNSGGFNTNVGTRTNPIQP